MPQGMHLTTLAGLTLVVLTAAGCSTSRPADARGLKQVIGTDLIGARGATPLDQRKIDLTVAGICGASLWTKQECRAHGENR